MRSTINITHPDIMFVPSPANELITEHPKLFTPKMNMTQEVEYLPQELNFESCKNLKEKNQGTDFYDQIIVIIIT